MRSPTGKGSARRFDKLPRRGGGVRAVKLALCATLLATTARAQPAADWRIDTFAGSGEVGDSGPATAAQLYSPDDVAVDGAGTLYIADRENHRIRKVDSSGVITTVAGTGERGFSGDGGPASAAQLYRPFGVAVDGAGTLYIADTGNRRIRKVDTTGVITTFAGTGRQGFSGDGGPATAARFIKPQSVALDGAGNLYIADRDDQRIRKVDTTGVITTVAGTGERGFSGDGGPATAARLGLPHSAALDGAGNLYIADTSNDRIRKVDTTGVITTFAGTGELGVSGDGGPATAARLRSPRGVALDGAGNLYIADSNSSRIRKVDSSGVITTFAGTGSRGFSGDGGPATAARLYWPRGVAVDGEGNLYIADMDNHRIRKVDTSGAITTVAGSEELGDGGPGTAAQLKRPFGVAMDRVGNHYIADRENHRIRKVDSSGVITTVAGTGERGFSGDGGPATTAKLRLPSAVAVDAAGNLFIVDHHNARIRKVDSSGVITTVAGTRERGFSGDGGPAISAQLRTPLGVALDKAGNLYIVDSGNHRIRKVDSSGVITTVAGTGSRGFSGDGGPATAARLNRPVVVAVDGVGNLYIADGDNHRIRKVDSSGVITTVAGTGERGFSGDGGPGTAAQLYYPLGVALDRAGNLYIADSDNHRIRKVDSSGVITTFAGTGSLGFSGDGGPGTAARLDKPHSVALDAAGNLYVVDTYNHRVRILYNPQPATGPFISAVLNAASFFPGAAPGSFQTIFGERLAPETDASRGLTGLAEFSAVRIEIIDATGTSRVAQLIYVSPGQINFLIPDATAPGAAMLRLTREGEEPVESALTISAVAPGLFSANGTGEGIGVITAHRVGADGSRSNLAVFRYDATADRVVGVPLNLGSEGEQILLSLFGTGIRGAGGAEAVQAAVGGSEVPVLFAGAHEEFAGLDRVEVGPLPLSLSGAGEVNVVVTAAGITSNTVTIVIE